MKGHLIEDTTNERLRVKPNTVLLAYKVPGDGVQAEGSIILYHRDPQVHSHPYVVHYFNYQTRGLSHGGYHTKLSAALLDFSARVWRFE